MSASARPLDWSGGGRATGPSRDWSGSITRSNPYRVRYSNNKNRSNATGRAAQVLGAEEVGDELDQRDGSFENKRQSISRTQPS